MSEELKARIAELEQQAATDADFIRQYQRETEALRGQIVSSWDMDEIPTFRQGAPIHEMEGLVTAEEVTGYVRRITEQREQIAELERVQAALVAALETIKTNAGHAEFVWRQSWETKTISRRNC